MCTAQIVPVCKSRCQCTSYPYVFVLGERATGVTRHVARFSPQNGRETTQRPAALSEQADAVTEFGLDELKCLSDAVVLISTDANETQRRLAYQSPLLRRFCQPRC